jgi:hypothetical protein
VRNFIIFTHPQILLGISRRMRWEGHVARVGEERVKVGKPEERVHLKDIGVDGRIGSEWILERLAGRFRVDTVGKEPVAGSCKYGNETAGSGAKELVRTSYKEHVAELRRD